MRKIHDEQAHRSSVYVDALAKVASLGNPRNTALFPMFLPGLAQRGTELAHAVAAGDEARAGALADEIADAVLSSPVVRLAETVRARGPLACAAALQIAAILAASASDGAASGRQSV